MTSAAPDSQRVLVVDDDKSVRDSLRRSLEFNGYTVSLAGDGAEALASIASATRPTARGALDSTPARRSSALMRANRVRGLKGLFR